MSAHPIKTKVNTLQLPQESEAFRDSIKVCVVTGEIFFSGINKSHDNYHSNLIKAGFYLQINLRCNGKDSHPATQGSQIQAQRTQQVTVTEKNSYLTQAVRTVRSRGYEAGDDILYKVRPQI